MKTTKMKLSNSLRKHIRRNKEIIRKNFGPLSPQEEDLMAKVREQKKQKSRLRNSRNRGSSIL